MGIFTPREMVFEIGAEGSISSLVAPNPITRIGSSTSYSVATFSETIIGGSNSCSAVVISKTGTKGSISGSVATTSGTGIWADSVSFSVQQPLRQESKVPFLLNDYNFWDGNWSPHLFLGFGLSKTGAKTSLISSAISMTPFALRGSNPPVNITGIEH